MYVLTSDFVQSKITCGNILSLIYLVTPTKMCEPKAIILNSYVKIKTQFKEAADLPLVLSVSVGKL